MRLLIPLCLAIASLALSSTAVSAQSAPPMLLEKPTVSRTHIAFSYAGDIWLVERGGGDARRLTTTSAREANPVFSPDGTQVAFARFNPTAGPFGWDVYVASISGGEERRVTYHPDLDFRVNWTSDSKSILIFSLRHRTFLFDGRLYTIPARGGTAVDVPVPRGWTGLVFSGGGSHRLYSSSKHPGYFWLEKLPETSRTKLTIAVLP